MSIVSELIAGGAAGLFQGIGSFAKDIRAAITGESIIDPNKKAELLFNAQALEAAAQKAQMDYETTLATLDAEVRKGQMLVNQVEAASSSTFTSGWRPAVGWVCSLGLFYTFLLKPILPWTVGVLSALFGHPTAIAAMPEVPMGDLIILLGGMLGLGTLRTIDKYNRVTGPPGDKGNA